jgi:hypothetical protein
VKDQNIGLAGRIVGYPENHEAVGQLLINQELTGQNLLAPLKEAKRFIIKQFGRYTH